MENWYGSMMGYGSSFDWRPWSLTFPFLFLLVWSLFWKGLALWHSAQRGKSWWFVAMLILNTAGILEIVYLFGFAKLKFDQLFTTKH